MEKPNTVPANAQWNPEDNQWDLGQYNQAGVKTGIWQSWHVEGHLCGTIDYKDGTPPFTFKRFHPDGTVAQEGNWYGGNYWLGTYRWTKSEYPTSEPFPGGASEQLWIVEFVYVREGIYHEQRYFNKAGQPVTATGNPLPARPANVPARAHFGDRQARWIMGEVDVQKRRYVGQYNEWDVNGLPTTMLVFDPETGDQVEEHQFKQGKLWLSNKKGPGDQLLKSFYYDNVEPAAVKNNVLYTNGYRHETHSFFSPTGELLYSIRNEDLGTGLHKKRYYNDTLIFESIQTADHDQPPISVHYYYPDGAVIIDYQSNRDGTGNWHLYEPDGKLAVTLPVPEEKDYNEFIGWQIFLTFNLDTNTTTHEWKLMKEKFMSRYTMEVIEQQVNNLAVPGFLQVELDKTDWQQIDAAMGGSKHLPKYINGLLVEDHSIAESCLGDLWMQIEHQGSVYSSTYTLGNIIATCLPHYAASPVIQSRLVQLLFDIVALPNIHDYPDLYKQLATSLTGLTPLFSTNADSEDDTIATQALYLLLHVGTVHIEVVDYFKKVFENTAYSAFRRSYAVFLLGQLYLRNGDGNRLIDELAPALDTIKEPMIRVVILIHLVTAAREEAAASWNNELLRCLAAPEELTRAFRRLQTLTGGYDLQDYILMLFRYANPSMLEDNISPIIAMLPQVHKVKQETLLHTILSVLFPEPSSKDDITPLRQQALLAAAAAIDTEIVDVNLTGLLHDYGLPATTAELRELAGSTVASN